MMVASPIWRRLFRHLVCWALAFALARAGNNILARIAMIAMTTSNSIKVNAEDRLRYERRETFSTDRLQLWGCDIELPFMIWAEVLLYNLLSASEIKHKCAFARTASSTVWSLREANAMHVATFWQADSGTACC